MKIRIVIWTIVGILVLGGVIVIASAQKPQPGPKVTLDVIKGEAVKAEIQLDRLAAQVAQARKATAPGATPNRGLEEADRLLAQTREKLGQAKQATDLRQAGLLLTDSRGTLRKARRVVEQATRTAPRPHGM